MSRRLDISSLLNDHPPDAVGDAVPLTPKHTAPVPEPVVLAPHLRRTNDDDMPAPPHPARRLYPDPSFYHRPSSSSSSSSSFSRSPAMPLAAPLPPSYPSSPIQQRPRHSPLLARPPSSHTPTPYYPTPPLHPQPPPSSSPSSPPKSLAGLEALVQAATQERRRLSGGVDPEHPPPTPLQDESHHRRSQPIDIKRSPQYQRHHRSQERLVDDPYPRPSLNPSTSTADDFSLRAASFPQSHLPRTRPEEPRLSPVALRTPYDDERYLHQPDQRRHHEHLLRQEQKLHQQQQRLEHQQRLEQQSREQHMREVQAREQQLRDAQVREQQARELQAQRDHEIMRAQEAKRAQEAERQRAEAVRMAEEAKRAEERRRMELQLERERLQEQEEMRLHEQRIREQREQQRLQEQRIHEQRLQEQRLQEQREQRLQEQREQQRLQEQREQQRLQEQRLQEQREQQRLQEQRIREQHEHQRLVEQQQSEPTVEPPRPRIQPESPSLMHHDDRPSKKPRYSQSPSRPEDKEKVVNGELGYGPPHHPPSSSAGPRRPGSGTGRRTMAVSDLVSVTDKERSIANANLQSDRPSHRVLSPLGRRSPPGSLTGRAIAARKTTDEVVEKKEPVTVSIPPAPQYTAPTQIVIPESEPPKVKEEPVAIKAPPREVRPPPPPAPPPVVAELPKKTKPKDHRTKEQQKEDAHDWLLEHYAREPSPEPSPRPEPPRSPSPSISPVVVASPSRPTVTTEVHSPSPEPTKRTPTPTREATPPKVDPAIEELEELVAETEAEIKPKPSSIVNKQEPRDIDMDLDELVAEALEDVPVTSKREEEEEEEEEEVPMEVDVEDELLSLVGDRPPPSSARRAVSGSSTSVPPSHPTKPIPLRMSTDAERQPSPPPATSLSAPTPSTLLSPVAPRSSSARPASERGSMPPPTTTPTAGSFPRAKEKEKEETAKKGERASSSAPPAKKKKETVATKPPAKLKVATGDKTTKARSKPPPKPKKGTETSSPVALPMKASKSGSGPGGKKTTSASRSRSASVMPAGSVGPEGDPQADKQEEEDSDGANDDDKLYCVCKTKYDEDRFMIACDRCDEWYHTQCVNLPELEVDLIDQFICPPCIEKNPEMSLKTTYKKRCLYGLKHPDPSSRKACHKPARGAFSKYCSEECGVKCMQLRIESYAKKGGKKDKLWESVKNAERREGVVVCVDNINGHIKMDVDESKEDGDVKPLSNKRSKVARETDRLKGSLEQIVKLREEIKKGMEVVIWRQKLLELASERAEQLELCGWDHRLCFSDDELADYGASVLESYEENGVKEENGDMQVDGAGENHGEWWCPGNASCGRHLGWQLTRYKDVCKEKEKKEEALMKLTTREREIRKHIEDIVDPQGRNTNEAPPQSPLKPVNTKLSNGHARSKLGGDGVKKGKKRKAPAS